MGEPAADAASGQRPGDKVKIRTEFSMALDYADDSMAERVMRAVQPDNEEVPEDTSIEMDVCGGSLTIRVSSAGDLHSFLRTVDDLLSCIQVAERAAKLDRVGSADSQPQPSATSSCARRPSAR